MKWFSEHAFVSTLCILMGIDILMGLLVAFGLKEVNSSISRIGMVRKVGTMLLVALAFILEPYTHGVPLGFFTTLAFIVTEAISVTENSAKLGIPVPKPLIEALSKLRGEKAARVTIRIEHPISRDEITKN